MDLCIKIYLESDFGSAMTQLASQQLSSKEFHLIHEQCRLRGQIIGAYSQCEFLLLDVAIQSRILQEYWALDLKYHRKLENRIAQASRLFASSGPLKKYEDRLTPLFQELEKFKSNRDFFAHAYCRIHHNERSEVFIYKMVRMDGQQMVEDERSFSLEELEALGSDLGALAQKFLLLFAEIYLTEGLEEFSRGFRAMP